MNKFIITITLLLSFYFSNAQAKKDTVKLTDTTAFLSASDLYRFADPYKDKVSARNFEIFLSILNSVIQDAAAAWNNKQKKPK